MNNLEKELAEWKRRANAADAYGLKVYADKLALDDQIVALKEEVKRLTKIAVGEYERGYDKGYNAGYEENF